MLVTKLLGGLLMPVPVILGLMLVGLLLVWRRRWRRMGMRFVVAGVALLLLLSLPQVPERLMLSLESRYSPLPEPPPVKRIVVLGGGATDIVGLPATGQLSAMSLTRLVEGIRLQRRSPDARLVFTGGHFHGGASIAETMGAAAVSLGVNAATIEMYPAPKTTAEEAQTIAAQLDPGEKVILVTSAFHMPRAVMLFEAQGVAVVPAPAGRLVNPRRSDSHIREQLPQTRYLVMAEIAFWEYLGMLWARLSG